MLTFLPKFIASGFAILLLSGACFAETTYRHTIALSGGIIELIDLEYQYAFNPYYVAFKPGFILMLGYYSHVHGWPAYPSIRFGMDLYKFKSIQIGPQIELAYFYSSPADHPNYLGSGGYSKKWQNDEFLISLGPAVRYIRKHIELQGCAGIILDNTIEFAEESTGYSRKKTVRLSDLNVYPMVRVSMGVVF